MGLAERRASHQFETSRFPSLKQQIDQAAMFEVPLEVKWDTLALEDEAHLYDESWSKVYFYPLIEALKSITRDAMGQEALKAYLKQIVSQNVNGAYYGDRWAHAHDGTLTLDHLPTTNVDDIQSRTDGLIKILEKEL
jgi:hypothetical protein